MTSWPLQFFRTFLRSWFDFGSSETPRVSSSSKVGRESTSPTPNRTPKGRPVDPQWEQIGASLRGDKLYVKLACSRAMNLARALRGEESTSYSRELATYLEGEVRRSSNVSIFLQLDVPAARRDIAHLEGFRDLRVRAYRFALLAGLDNHPDVDWITRVGGPQQRPLLPRGLEPL